MFEEIFSKLADKKQMEPEVGKFFSRFIDLLLIETKRQESQ